jgi:hypothetical protein
MTWTTLQQLIRIAGYSVGSWWFGENVADGELFQAAIGGVVAVGAFAWWAFWERDRPALAGRE